MKSENATCIFKVVDTPFQSGSERSAYSVVRKGASREEEAAHLRRVFGLIVAVQEVDVPLDYRVGILVWPMWEVEVAICVDEGHTNPKVSWSWAISISKFDIRSFCFFSSKLARIYR